MPFNPPVEKRDPELTNRTSNAQGEAEAGLDELEATGLKLNTASRVIVALRLDDWI